MHHNLIPLLHNGQFSYQQKKLLETYCYTMMYIHVSIAVRNQLVFSIA